MGIKGSTTGEIFFNDMRIPADNLLGEEGEEFQDRDAILDRSGRDRARGLGLARATDYALEYAPGPRDDGQADRAAPADLGHLADMETKCEAARLRHKCGR